MLTFVQDDANATAFEHDIMQTQLRHGGDVLGLIDSLDYIQGMGMKAIYLAGSPMINLPWESDGTIDGLGRSAMLILTLTSTRLLTG